MPSGKFSEMSVGLTLFLELETGAVGRAPEAYVSIGDIGSPGEKYGVDVVEGQLGIRIDPVHIPTAVRHEAIRDKPEEDCAAAHIFQSTERHFIYSKESSTI